MSSSHPNPSLEAPWFQRGYRRMLVDMHIPDWDEAFLAAYDPAAMAAMIERVGLTSAMIYCQSHVGLCNWPTRSGKMHAGLRGRDVTGELLGELHQRGLAVCAYYSVVYNNWAYLEHPDWRICPPGGSIPVDGSFAGKRYGHCCPNNPDYLAFTKAQTAELMEDYDFDGLFFDMTFWPSICVCEHCRTRFRRETGWEIPDTIDWFAPAWCAFQTARERWMKDFSEQLTRHAKSICPGISVYHNFAASLFNWTLGLPFAAAQCHDFMGADFYGDTTEQLMVSKFMAGLSCQQPVEFMTSCCVNLRDHVQLKSVEEMRRQAFAATLFSGAFLFIDAINPDGTTHPVLAERIRSIYAETAPYEPFLGGEAVADIALYFSDDSRMDFTDNGLPLTSAPYWSNQYPHSQAMRGLCRILQEAHLPFAIITRKNLSKLSKYRVVALPNILRMSHDEAAAFRDYVQNGGHLYASGQTSLTETNGSRRKDFLLADVFGCHADLSVHHGTVTYLKPAVASVANAIAPQFYISVFQPSVSSGACVVPLTEQVEGEILATTTLPYASPQPGSIEDHAWASIHSSPPWLDTANPFVVQNHFGQGSAIYTAAALEMVATEANRRLVSSLLQTLLGPKPTYSAKAHPAVWMNVQHHAHSQAYTIAFLNNQTQEPPLPIPELSFSLRPAQGKAFSRLVQLPANTPVPFSIDADGTLKAKVADCQLFIMLKAEYCSKAE
jgi:hypothetical protein